MILGQSATLSIPQLLGGSLATSLSPPPISHPSQPSLPEVLPETPIPIDHSSSPTAHRLLSRSMAIPLHSGLMLTEPRGDSRLRARWGRITPLVRIRGRGSSLLHSNTRTDRPIHSRCVSKIPPSARRFFAVMLITRTQTSSYISLYIHELNNRQIR